MKAHDVGIIGGGPAGSSLAARLRLKGMSVILFEKENFPRFQIGESLLPASMPLLEEIGFTNYLRNGNYLEKWGAKFLHLNEEIYFNFQNGFNSEIPMAYEVQRAQFDLDLLNHCQELGTEVHQNEKVEAVVYKDSEIHLSTSRKQYSFHYVADASGRNSILGRQYNQKEFKKFFNSFSVFAHFKNVPRSKGKQEGDIIIVILSNKSWMWFIPFSDGKTSIGLVCNQIPEGNRDWLNFILEHTKECPLAYELVANAEQQSPFQTTSNYSHQCQNYWGPRHLLIGDSALFMDPCFSSGVHTALQSAKFASQTLSEAVTKNHSDLDTHNLGEAYQNNLNRGVKRFHNLIEIFYQPTFVSRMKKTLSRKNLEAAFTSAIAGDMWNEDNILFNKGVL